MAYLAALHFGVAYGSNEICKEYPYPHAKDCPTYDPALVWLWQIGETLNFWSPAVAAVAAVAVAAFTLTLKWSTDRQAQFTGESIKLAKEQFESEHRPWVGVEHEEPAGEISIYARETIVSIKLDLINTGSCPAFDFFIEGDVIGIKDESKINDVIKTLKTKFSRVTRDTLYSNRLWLVCSAIKRQLTTRSNLPRSPTLWLSGLLRVFSWTNMTWAAPQSRLKTCNCAAGIAAGPPPSSMRAAIAAAPIITKRHGG